MVIAFCSHESLAQRKGIIGECISVITIREPGEKKRKRKETEENILLKCSRPSEESSSLFL